MSEREEMSELEQMRLVASDRLVWLRLLEKAVNDIDGVIGSLKNDVAEISRQVAARHEGLTLAPSEEETEEESDD